LHLFRTASGWWIQCQPGHAIPVPADDHSGDLTCREDLGQYLQQIAAAAKPLPVAEPLLAPIQNQEVWASGVTYYRSRSARMEDSKTSGGSDFYDRVYNAERPELFFKTTPHRVVGPGENVRIRRDSKWNVPEPELALLISPGGKILGYTIGNDMSSRDIEGENPLYLPQAKTFDRCCALGPSIHISPNPLPTETAIRLLIRRGGLTVFEGESGLVEMKRPLQELVSFLFRECSFPSGCILLTGTGIVPPDGFTLAPKDEVEILIEGIGQLINTVEIAA
jgi:2-dehydro-3-deoxy-D-arabinonate dehydratase